MARFQFLETWAATEKKMLRPSQPIRKVLSAGVILVKLPRTILEMSASISGIPPNESPDPFHFFLYLKTLFLF